MKITLLFIFVFIAGSLFAQTITDINIELPYYLLEIEKPNVYGKVKKIKQTVFNCKKRKGKIKNVRTDRESNIEFQFSAEGCLIKYIDLNRYQDNIQTIDFYKQDSIVEIIKKDAQLLQNTRYVYVDGLLKSVTTKIGISELNSLFIYDSKRTLIEWLFYDSEEKPSQKVTYKFLPDSLIEYRKFYFPDTTNLRRTYKYVYDEKKKLIDMYEFEGEYKSQKKFDYDSLGNIICITDFNLAFNQISWTKYEYVFDSHGNWIEKKHIFIPPKEYITKKSYYPKLITKREIEYYEDN
jgi:hypothetical protein